MHSLKPSGATSPHSPYLSARPPRNPSGLVSAFVLSSSGVVRGVRGVDRFLGSFKTTRSVSHGHDDSGRPTGVPWTVPRPQDGQPARERSKTWVKADAVAVDAMATLAAKKLGDDKLKDKDKDKDKDQD